MISKRNITILAVAAIFSLNLASCSKKNAEVETDYAAKKASAETLMTQISSSMASMKTDHDQWMATLTTASAKPSADTSKIASLKSDIAKHEAMGDSINVLMDSTKAYMNATPDMGADAFKNADDQLGTNFNNLNDKWKSFQDTHTSLAQQVQQYAVTAAGNAADTAKAKAEAKTETKAPEKKAAPKEMAPKHKPGVARKSAQ